MTYNEFRNAYIERFNYDHGKIDHVDVNNGVSFMERSIGMFLYKILTDQSYYNKCRDAFCDTLYNKKEQGESREVLRYDDFVIRFKKEQRGTDKLEYHQCLYFASDAIIDAAWICDMIHNGDIVFINSRELARKSDGEINDLIMKKFEEKNNENRSN